jgi:hypothetical protein
MQIYPITVFEKIFSSGQPGDKLLKLKLHNGISCASRFQERSYRNIGLEREKINKMSLERVFVSDQ